MHREATSGDYIKRRQDCRDSRAFPGLNLRLFARPMASPAANPTTIESRYARLCARRPASVSEMAAGFPSFAPIFWHPHDAVYLSELSVHVAMLHRADFTGQ